MVNELFDCHVVPFINGIYIRDSSIYDTNWEDGNDDVRWNRHAIDVRTDDSREGTVHVVVVSAQPDDSSLRGTELARNLDVTASDSTLALGTIDEEYWIKFDVPSPIRIGLRMSEDFETIWVVVPPGVGLLDASPPRTAY